ncbi:MAG: hypothetical protein GC181_14610 [Bacteroidetes bacterium]|nr:hypothetical protein [Bacteroidota bacterium]
MALFPFVLVRDIDIASNPAILNHEKIHHQQQKELLLIFFYLIYILEFLIRYLQLHNWDEAYKSISFEKEAYQNEKDLNYLKSRSLYSMWK